MRLANIDGRATLLTSEGALDLERVTGGRFGPDIHGCYDRWEQLLELVPDLVANRAVAAPAPAAEDFGNPVPMPRQVFAIGLNYAEHAAEVSVPLPEELTVFTKFASSLAPPYGTVALPPGTVDWEVELVVVIGRGGRSISTGTAWDHVAGLTVGQDLSERTRQLRGSSAQYSLAKSFAGFAPVGPVLVTPDEFDDPDDIELGCLLNGEVVQHSRTSDLVFPVPEIIARLSEVVELTPGDAIFTGTPSGVGVGRSPQRFLSPGDELVTYATGVGEMRHTFAPARPEPTLRGR